MDDQERKAKKSKKARKYYERHRDEILAKRQAYHQRTKDIRNQKSKEYRQRHLDERIQFSRDYYASHKDEIAFQKKNKNYGISVEEYNALFEKQQGCCGICFTPQMDCGKALGIDHCHDTGQIRGLLCTKCNFGLGSFKDSTILLKNAIAYLELL